jgi:hypothetical protein
MLPLRRTIFGCLLVVISVTVPHALASRSFAALTDQEKEFSGQIPGAKDTVITISRKMVEGIRLEGPEGYTAFLVRTRPRSLASPPEDTLTLFAGGQYRLLGYDKNTRVLFACRIRQIDGGLWISDVLSLEEHYMPGTSLGPPGRYQYVSLSQNANSLVLVDEDVTVVDLDSRRWRRLGVDPALTTTEANPVEAGASSLDRLRLDGRFIEMRWKDGATGTLVIRDAEGTIAREIAVDAKLPD